MSELWKPDAIIQLAQMWEGDVGTGQIAQALSSRERKVSPKAVYRKAVSALGKRPRGPWKDPELVARVTKLWTEGHSASECADMLNEEFDLSLTRTAIIGKVHRLKLTRSCERRAGRPRIHRPRREQPPKLTRARPAKPAPVEAPHPLHLNFSELTTSTCKFPFGDHAPFSYCGHPAPLGSSWCPYHRGVVFSREPNYIDRMASQRARGRMQMHFGRAAR